MVPGTEKNGAWHQIFPYLAPFLFACLLGLRKVKLYIENRYLAPLLVPGTVFMREVNYGKKTQRKGRVQVL